MDKLISQLRKIRQSEGWSQSDLSQRLRLPQSHLSKIENGKTDIRLSSLRDIAAALGYELVLVPNKLSSQISAIIAGEALSEPRWQPDPDDDDE